MPIRMNCPACHAKLAIPDQYAGRRGKCPKCSSPIDVPTTGDPPPRQEERFGFGDLEPPRQFGDDELQLEDPPPQPADEPRRPCPACGEKILRDAVKCRFCGEIFDPVLKKQEKKARLAASGDGDLTAGEWGLAIICSGIGCIMGIVWMIQGKPKGKKMFLVSFGMQCLWGLVRIALEAANRNQGL